MSSLAELTQRLMHDPSPEALWELQPYLLALGTPEAESARRVAGQFYVYLSHVRSKLTSKEYSSLAAKLAASSIGTISLQEFLESMADDRRTAITSLLGGGLASSFELMSTLQHVKAWDTEFSLEHEAAVWDLYATWWQVSVEAQPGLDAQARARLIGGMLTPLRDPQLSSQARLGLVIGQFQALLMVRLVPLLVAEARAAHG